MGINLIDLKARIDDVSQANRLRLAADLLIEQPHLAEAIAAIVVHELKSERERREQRQLRTA